MEILMFCIIKSYIYAGIDLHRFYGDGIDLTQILLAKGIEGVCIFDCPGNNLLVQKDGYNDTYSQIISTPKGNIKEKISQLMPDLENIIDEIFNPITKEEYESMITYKPE